MSLLAALLLAAGGAPAASPVDEIIVIGRLERLSVNVGQDREGRWHCSLDGSSGVPRLDERLCKAVTTCVRKGAVGDDAVRDCVTRNKATLIERFKKEMRSRR